MTPRKRFQILALSLAILAAISLAAFWQSIGARIASPPAEQLSLAVSNNYLGSGLVFIAARNGYFVHEGLDITLQPHASGRDALDAALAKTADLATVGDTPMMFAIMQEAPVSVIATIYSAGGAHGIVARRDRGIASPGDLGNKTIGTALRTDGHFITSVLMAGDAKSFRTVRFMNLKPGEMAEALQSGRVDAIATWEPWLQSAKDALGDGGVTFRTKPGFLFGFHLAGRKEWVEANPERIRRLLKALLRAEQFLMEAPAQAQAIIIEATGADARAFTHAGASGRFHVALTQSLLIMLEDQARWAIEAGLVERKDVPNVLASIHFAGLDAVKPGVISIVR